MRIVTTGRDAETTDLYRFCDNRRRNFPPGAAVRGKTGTSLSDLLTIEILASVLGNVPAAILILVIRLTILRGVRYPIAHLGAKYPHLDAKRTIRDTIMADPRSQAKPDPFVQVNTLNARSVDFLLRVWCKREDYFQYQADMKRRVKEVLDAGGIDIPFPTRTILQTAYSVSRLS